MVILGVDPGLVNTGWGVLEATDSTDIKYIASGVIRTSSKDDISQRLAFIYSSLEEMIRKFEPGVLVLEKLYSHYKHPITSVLMGHARGVVCLAAGLGGIKLVNYPSTRIKKCITGNGRARKDQVQFMVKAMLGLDKDFDDFDASDALAMALAYIYIERR